MAMVFVTLGSLIVACGLLFAAGFVVYMTVLILKAMFGSVGLVSDSSPAMTIVIPNAKTPKIGRDTNASNFDRQSVQSGPFFEDVSGIDLEYRGVGTGKGSS